MNEIKGLTQRNFFFRYSCSYHNLMAFSREDNNESSTETSPQQKKNCFAFLPNYFSFKSFVKRLWIKPKWPWSANLAPHNNRKKPSTGWNSSNRLDRWTWRWLAKSPSKKFSSFFQNESRRCRSNFPSGCQVNVAAAALKKSQTC